MIKQNLFYEFNHAYICECFSNQDMKMVMYLPSKHIKFRLRNAIRMASRWWFDSVSRLNAGWVVYVSE